MMEPETRFASVGEDRVGWQQYGAGPRDLLSTTGLWGHIDMMWENPSIARFLRRLGGFARVIRFDRRGSGVSDRRPAEGGLLEHWIEDLLAVMDAAQTEAPIIFAGNDAGPLVLEFLARHPQRCSGLIFAITTACTFEAPDYAAGHPASFLEQMRQMLLNGWGREEFATVHTPSQAHNPDVLRWYAKFQRAMASPRTAVENVAMLEQLDARHVLPQVQVPTLVLGRAHSKIFTAAQSRYIAERIPGARYVELPGADGTLHWEGAEEALTLIEEFVTGRRGGSKPERELATVLFTDIVDSTRRAVELGDAAWHALLDRHDAAVREQIARFGGELADSAGDGTLATFRSPGTAIECAQAIHEQLRALTLQVRAGIHIGELERREDGRVGGIAVHIGARVLGHARPGEVLVSRTVRDVLIGAPYRFKDRGIHELRNVPSRWPLYCVEFEDRSAAG